MNHGSLAVDRAKSFHCARHVLWVCGVHACVHVSLCENLVESANNKSRLCVLSMLEGERYNRITGLRDIVNNLAARSAASILHILYLHVVPWCLSIPEAKQRIRCFANRFVYYFIALHIIDLLLEKRSLLRSLSAMCYIRSVMSMS